MTGLSDALAAKVSVEAGKGLSTNDYTNEEKSKLTGIEAGAQANVIEVIKINGADAPISEKGVNLSLIHI